MKQIKIDDNVPAPPKYSRSEVQAKYPFRLLQVNQSFLVLLEPNDTLERLESRVKNAAFRATRVTKHSFLCRLRNKAEHKEDGIRVWRIA